MEAEGNQSPNAKHFTEFDKLKLENLEIGGSCFGEGGNWSVHRYDEKSYVLLINQSDFPAVEVDSLEKVFRVFNGGKLGPKEFKNLMDIWKNV